MPLPADGQTLKQKKKGGGVGGALGCLERETRESARDGGVKKHGQLTVASAQTTSREKRGKREPAGAPEDLEWRPRPHG